MESNGNENSLKTIKNKDDNARNTEEKSPASDVPNTTVNQPSSPPLNKRKESDGSMGDLFG